MPRSGTRKRRLSVLLVAATSVAVLASGCSTSSDSAVTVFVQSTAGQPRSVTGIQTRPALSTSADAGSEPASTRASTTASTRASPVRTSPVPSSPVRSNPVRSSRRSPPEKAGTFTIAFAGDVHFSGRTRTRLDDNPATAFGVAATALSGADLTMVNLETAITTGGEKQNKSFTFSAPPSALTALRQAGVDVATEANNHGADYGASGLADTLAAIEKSKFPVIGIGRNAARAYAPHTVTVNGARVAILAASQVRDETLQNWTAENDSPGIASAYSPRLVEAVKAAKAAGNLVVVYVHWGTEYAACPDTAQRELADTLAAAGATAVVGTHAHVLQGAGFSQGRGVCRLRAVELPVVALVRQRAGRRRRADAHLLRREGHRLVVRGRPSG